MPENIKTNNADVQLTLSELETKGIKLNSAVVLKSAYV
jgi:hypothetical protein